MNYIVKGVLKRILSKYLNISDQISLEKGHLQLPSGHFNLENINSHPSLLNSGFTLVDSNYEGLAISLPVLEIMSKPITLRIDNLRLIIEAKPQSQNKVPDKNKKPVQSSKQGNEEKEDGELKQSKGYVKGLVNRLLMGAELEIKNLTVIVRKSKVGDSKLSIQGFVVKNSLSFLEANLVKKIVSLTSLSASTSSPDSANLLASVSDLHMSFNLDNTKLGIVCLLDEIRLEANARTIQMLIQLLSRGKKASDQPHVNGQLEPDSNLRHQQSEQAELEVESEAKVLNGEDLAKQKQSHHSLKSKSVPQPNHQDLPTLCSIELKVNTIKVALLHNQKPSFSEASLRLINIEFAFDKKSHTSSTFGLALLESYLNIGSRETPVLAIGFKPELEQKKGRGGKQQKRKKAKLEVQLFKDKFIKLISVQDLQVQANIGPELAKEATNLLMWVERVSEDFRQGQQPRKVLDGMVVEVFESLARASNISIGATLQQDGKQFSLQLELSQHEALQLKYLNCLTPQFVLTCTGVKCKGNSLNVLSFSEVMIGYQLKARQSILSMLKNNPELCIEPLILQEGKPSAVELQARVPISLLNQYISPFRNSSQFIVEAENIDLEFPHKLFLDFELIEPTLNKCVGFLNSLTAKKAPAISNRSQQKQPYQSSSSMKLFLRVGHANISVGQLSQSGVYFPVFLIKLAPMKANALLGTQASWALQLIMKEVLSFSPHNLSSSSLLKSNVRFRMEGQRTNFSLEVKDPFSIEAQQQHLLLALALFSSFKGKGSMFTTVQNSLDRQIMIIEDSSEGDKKNSWAHLLAPKICQYTVTAGGSKQVYLSSLKGIKIGINGEVSQPIEISAGSLTSQGYEVGIMFNYHDECRLILEARPEGSHLHLRVKSKYEVHIFKGLEGAGIPRISLVEFGCSKFNKIAQYRPPQDGSGHAAVLSLDWEPTEQDKIAHLSITIQMEGTDKHRYSIDRLMANSLKYKLYGLHLDGEAVYHYYLLEETPGEVSENEERTHIFYLMPFLIMRNNLDVEVLAIIKNKKFKESQDYVLLPETSQVVIGKAFDYYMKQYVMSLSLNAGRPQCYISEEHYLNTFFMVEDSFNSTIELRSAKNNKKHLSINESFLFKTKILSIDNSLRVSNSTEEPIEVSILLEKGHPPISSFPLEGHGQVSTALRLRKQNVIRVTHLGNQQETHIDVPIKDLQQNFGTVLLSFNFCRGREGMKEEKESFQQILISMSLEEDSLTKTLQIIKFTYFLTMRNLCDPQHTLRINGQILQSELWGKESAPKSLRLPSNSNKAYNNKWLALTSFTIQKIYDELLGKRDGWICESESTLTEIRIEGKSASSVLYLEDLLTYKIIEHNKRVYSLVKNLQNGHIQLTLSDRLVNPTPHHRYFLLSNKTDQSFLMNPPEDGYGRFLLESDPQGDSGKLLVQAPAHEKVLIQGRPHGQTNILLNKEKYEVFFCGEESTNLKAFSAQRLQKMRMKQEKYEFDNFTVLEFAAQKQSALPLQKKMSDAQMSPLANGITQPSLQLTTTSISFKLWLKSRSMNVVSELKNLHVRIFSTDKADCLVRDIAASIGLEEDSTAAEGPKLRMHPLIRVPEESYLLMEGQIFADKIFLLKNVFLKCKIMDVHIHQHLLKVITHLRKVFEKKSPASSTGIHQNSAKASSTDKIKQLAQQPFFLVRSLYAHPINLCLTVKTNPELDFSSMIAIPELSLNSKSYRPGLLAKQLARHYMTNIIGKFPKLSFVYHNIRSPIRLIKSIVEARQNLTQDQGTQGLIQKQALSRCFINIGPKKAKKNQPLGCHQRIHHFLVSTQASTQQPMGQVVLRAVQNVIFCNLSKLNQISNLRTPISYLITNSKLYILTADLPADSFPLKDLSSAKISRLQKNNAEITITFKKHLGCLKVLDDYGACKQILRLLKSLIV